MIDASTIPSESRPPVRLCAACTLNIDDVTHCKRQHCRKTFHTQIANKGTSCYELVISSSTQIGAELVSFRTKLRTFEFAKEGSFRPRIRRAAYKIMDPSHYANAGPIHVALTFGPLMIENGLKPYVITRESCNIILSHVVSTKQTSHVVLYQRCVSNHL
jgi:hypothetical protein